jgi:hypothetical protein
MTETANTDVRHAVFHRGHDRCARCRSLSCLVGTRFRGTW